MAVTVSSSLSPASADAVRALAAALAERDGTSPLNDHSLGLLAGGTGVTHLLAHQAGALTGYAQVSDGSGEIAARDLDTAREALTAAGPQLREIWSHGSRSPLPALLSQAGFARTRRLLQLRRPASLPLAAAPPPAGVKLRPFVPGRDEDAWLAVNAAAFTGLPDQGGWDRSDLEAREAEPWFDPAGFLLAWRGEQLLGFHWTKVHPDGLGEVYVIAVAPAAQGLGLGTVLLVAGLGLLAERGCPQVLLYVDAANSGALALYRRFGFADHDVDEAWTRPATDQS